MSNRVQGTLGPNVLTPWTYEFVVDDRMDAFLGDTQLSGNVIIRYSSVCHDDVMNLDNGLL